MLHSLFHARFLLWLLINFIPDSAVLLLFSSTQLKKPETPSLSKANNMKSVWAMQAEPLSTCSGSNKNTTFKKPNPSALQLMIGPLQLARRVCSETRHGGCQERWLLGEVRLWMIKIRLLEGNQVKCKWAVTPIQQHVCSLARKHARKLGPYWGSEASSCSLSHSCWRTPYVNAAGEWRSYPILIFQGEFQGVTHYTDTTAVHHPTIPGALFPGRGTRLRGGGCHREKCPGRAGCAAGVPCSPSAFTEFLEKTRYLPHRITLIKCQCNTILRYGHELERGILYKISFKGFFVGFFFLFFFF